MSIIKNAIDSIQIGVEDFQSDDDRRSISAVRNIAAGILLLYKEKLCQLSPDNNRELLIKQNIRPVKNEKDEIVFEGKGHKTVDVQSIKERFRSLNVTVDWGRFDEINKLRNDLEHYYTSESPDAVREIVAKSFLLIRDFLSDHLDQDPQESLGNDCWAALLEVSDVYSAEDKACQATINAIDWKYHSVEMALKNLRCNQCYSSLIQALYLDDCYPMINLHCKSCGHDFCFDEVIEQCIDDSLAGEVMRNAMDGGNSPYDACHECGKSTFIHEEGVCVACGYEMEYTYCEMCEEPLSLEEQYNAGKCSYCQYKWEKIMAE
ncbi:MULTISPECIES: hypothetical protein [Morganellaceae]|uniref:hypothetical protein n=1 Tax=Morganellaceae TaxID=1903414 RepID=UPI000F5C0567|nr:hypothetical protein [Proteus mirabilis]MBS3827691.1 hypothetical protein [Proteus mirabilis]MBS3838506.1 hypothetical protein [Proteus mirabilis]MDC9789284.1 hypothetical protein [Proteus mirabilis]RQW15558.1 hypothetical protein EHQ54_10480 [Proteus mirabilis]HDU8445776.1 hypothetical protein [Proteus mirabilis]